MSTIIEKNNAPIVELVVGLHFNGAEFSNQEIYNFYNKIKDSYPIIQEQPALPFLSNKSIDFEKDKQFPVFSSRKFFINELENKLIQIQLDKVLFNWRKTHDEEQYPHFNKVFSEFFEILKKIKSIDVISKSILQLEITYLDHIWLDDFDRDDFNPTGIFNLYNLSGPINSLRSNFVFPNPEVNGSITIDLKSAINNIKGKKIFVLETNCRGSLGDKTIEGWFDCAHSNIHDLFFKIISVNAKSKWGI